jgi:hypothetical protein
VIDARRRNVGRSPVVVKLLVVKLLVVKLPPKFE